ncbi:hypothetical protein KSS87_002908 [Heliosperma pusillum]|nr:hypothetical protein KSS87_002908 [Heliosperma pusillum]
MYNNNSENNYSGFPEVKIEEFHPSFDYSSPSYKSYFVNGGDQNMLKFMQRSYSSNSFEGKPGFLPQQPRFDTLVEVQNFQPDIESNQMRRVCSTGDLPKIGMKQQTCSTQQTICSSSPLSGESSNFNEEANFKVGRYNAEERKERIDRYRAKRTQRNFNKTIKYACRKTLADNRPRIRGRFARNDETGEIPKPTSFNHPYNEDDDDLWVDNMQEEEEERILGRGGGRFLTHFGATQFQYCRY